MLSSKKQPVNLKLPLFLSIVLIAIISISCGNNPSATKSISQVTVSIPPLKYLVDKISGNEISVNVMVSSGACQETYEPTPAQMKEVAKSAIYFGISDLEFEQKWLKNITTNNPSLTYKNLGEGIIEGSASCGHSHCDNDHHSHGGVDPHFWLSAHNYNAMATAAYTELVAAYPNKKEQYERNYKALVASIDSIDADAKNKFAAVKQKKFIIYHPALTYFANDYGLIQIAIEKDGKEPDAGHIKSLVTIAKKEGIKTIFVQKEFDMSIIKSFASEINAKIEPINTFAYDWVANMGNIVNAISTSSK